MMKTYKITDKQPKDTVANIIIAASFVIAILSVTAYLIGKAMYYTGY